MMAVRKHRQPQLSARLWNSPLRWGLYLLITVLIGLAGEVIYNLPVERQDDYVYIPETEVEMENFSLIGGNTFVSGGGAASLTFSFEKQYVDKLFYRFAYNNRDAFSCQIQVRGVPGWGESGGQSHRRYQQLCADKLHSECEDDSRQDYHSSSGECGLCLYPKYCTEQHGKYFHIPLGFCDIVCFFFL